MEVITSKHISSKIGTIQTIDNTFDKFMPLESIFDIKSQILRIKAQFENDCPSEYQIPITPNSFIICPSFVIFFNFDGEICVF